MMGWYHEGMSSGGWLLMAGGMVAFWALVVFAIMAIFRSGRHERAATGEGRDPVGILNERFARGEIDEAEYHERAGVLRSAVH